MINSIYFQGINKFEQNWQERMRNDHWDLY